MQRPTVASIAGPTATVTTTSTISRPTAANQYSIRQDRLGSSLLLQQFIYYQGFFSFCWFIANETLITLHRIHSVSQIKGTRIISFAFTLIFPAIELLRVPLGFYANLKEDVAALGVFILLTLGAMIVPAFLLSNKNPGRWGPDKALNTVLLVMLGVEFVLSIYTVGKIIAENKRRFVLSEMAVRAQNPKSSAYMHHHSGPVPQAQAVPTPAAAPSGAPPQPPATDGNERKTL